MGFPPLRMALPPLHDRIEILATYAGQFVRWLAGAIILMGLLVAVNRLSGMSPSETRPLLPVYVLVGLVGSAVLAAVTTWVARRKAGRRRRRY